MQNLNIKNITLNSDKFPLSKQNIIYYFHVFLCKLNFKKMQVQKVLTFEEYAAKCKAEDKLYVRKVFLKSTRFENSYNFVLKESVDSFTLSGHWQVVQIPTQVPESVKEIISEPKKK